MIQRLYVFDMDGTLARTPEPHWGKEWWRYHTRCRAWPNGLRWDDLYRGWWGLPESLEGPPGFPFPIHPIQHVLDAYRAAKEDPAARVVVMSGRVDGERMRSAVVGCLRKIGLTDLRIGHDLFLKPPQEQGRRYVKTVDWKKSMLRQLRAAHPDLREIHVWEDRDEHAAAFRDLLRTFGLHFTVNLVKDPNWSSNDMPESA